MNLGRLFLAVIAAVSACADNAALAVAWTVGGEAPEGRAEACSSHGLDVVQIVTTLADTGGLHSSHWFPCSVGRGETEGLEPAQVDVHVFGLAPGYELLVEAEILRNVEITEDDVTFAEIDLPEPRSCADRADNDGDGRIDANDEDCGESGIGEEAP